MPAEPETLANDLLWGAEAIASFIGRSTRATYHMLESRELPARKTHGRWVASARKLREHFEEVLQ